MPITFANQRLFGTPFTLLLLPCHYRDTVSLNLPQDQWPSLFHENSYFSSFSGVRLSQNAKWTLISFDLSS